MTDSSGHHLLKHTAPSVQRVIKCFDGAQPKDIVRLVARMGQRELQAKFNAVYNTVTRSNNNEWLRRKLLEAIGVKAACKGKATPKPSQRKNTLASDYRPVQPSSMNKALSRRDSGDFSERSSVADTTAIFEAASHSQQTHGDSLDSPRSSTHSQGQWGLHPAQAPPRMVPLSLPGHQRMLPGSICYVDTTAYQQGGYCVRPVTMPQSNGPALLRHGPSAGGPYKLPPSARSSAPLAPHFARSHMQQQQQPGSSAISSSSGDAVVCGPGDGPCYYSAALPPYGANPYAQAQALPLQPDAMRGSPLFPCELMTMPAGASAATHAAFAHATARPAHAPRCEADSTTDDGSDATHLCADLLLGSHAAPAWDDWTEGTLAADVLELIAPKVARTAAEHAIDDVMDEAIDSFIDSAYSDIFPELVTDVTKTMARLNNGLAQWQYHVEQNRSRTP